MICPRCGNQNNDDALFCIVCGVRFVDQTAHDARRGMSEGVALTGLEDTLYRILSAEGVSALRNPKRLVGLVSDLCDQSSREYKVFEYNCDDNLLRPFAEALEQGVDTPGLDEAANRATLVLAERSIEQEIASSTILCIRNAIARAVGLGVVAAAPARVTAPEPVPPRAATQTYVRPTPQAPRPAYQAAEQPRQIPQPAPQQASQPIGRPKQSGSSGVVAVLMVLLILTAGAAMYLFVSNKGSATTQTTVSAPSNASNGSASSAGEDTVADTNDDTATSGTDGANESPAPSADDTSSNTEPDVGSTPEPENGQSLASEFPRLWSGTYDGIVNDSLFLRQLLFEFYEVSDDGRLTGACYVGVEDEGPSATYGSSTVEGTIDWNTGALYLRQTGWIDQGGIGPEREYQGTVNFDSWSMSGYLSTKDENNFDVPWRCTSTTSLNWRKP